MEVQYIDKTFEGIKPDEKVVLWIDKHWILRVAVIALWVIITVIPGVIGYLLINAFVQDSASFATAMTFLFVYELFALLYGFISLLNEELDLFIITNKRVIDVDQINFIQRKVSDMPIVNIQDVSYECKGLLGTLLTYGTIHVTTAAGDSSNIRIRFVPEVFRKAEMMLKLVHSLEANQTNQQKQESESKPTT